MALDPNVWEECHFLIWHDMNHNSFRSLFIVLVPFLLCFQAGTAPMTAGKEAPKVYADTIPAPPGWRYFDGDEFDGGSPKPTHWKLYGAPDVGNAAYGQGRQQMIQTYRPEQVTMHTLPTGERICRITSVKGRDAPTPRPPVADKIGWWSGALSSRDAGKFYPLYCRMEIRAKVPNVEGVWHAFWNRFFQGALIAELDIQEFFVKEQGLNVLSQSTHLYHAESRTTSINIPRRQNRHFAVSDPGNTFHVYGVQIDPDPEHPDEVIISYLLDGKINYSFSTNSLPGHNKFVMEAKKGQLDSAWDMAITGQIGGEWVGFPADSVTKVVTEIDWFRCFVRNEN